MPHLYELLYLECPLEKSYRPPKRPLTEKEIDELCDEWTPEPLTPIPEELNYEPPVLESGYVGINWITTETCTKSLEKYGVGSCGPRGFYGTIDVHLECETKIAKFLGTPDSILYSYGLSTMFSIIPAFCKKETKVCSGEYKMGYTCLEVQFCISNTITWSLYEVFWRKLPRKTSENSGQIAPLDEIIRLKEKYRFRVILDEGNSFGVLGSSGRGLAEHCKVPIDKVDIVTAAMGHALATEGGFCTGSTRVIDHQRLSSSGYVFSASLPPDLASAAITVIDVLERNPDLITKLKKNTSTLYKGLSDVEGLEIMSDPQSPIVFLRLEKSTGSVKGDFKVLEDICDHVLKEDSIFVATSKRSTIDKCNLPVGIRLFVSAAHTEPDLLKACESIKRATTVLLPGQ